MGRNLDVLTAAQLANRLKHLCLIEVEHEVDFLSVLYEVVAFVARARLQLIERQPPPVAQKITLDISRGSDFKRRCRGGQDQRASRIHLYLDHRGLRRSSLRFRFEL